jgi:quinol monooxygenase YgiN
MIHVIATVELRPGTRDRFLTEFSRIRPQVQAENGCIEYGAAVDLASGVGAQPPLRPDTVIIVERWTNLRALESHLAAPHMGPYRDRVKDFAVKATIQVLEPVDSVAVAGRAVGEVTGE